MQATVADTDVPELSIVVPMYNESQGVALFVSRLEEVLAKQTASFEILLVDDGSHDGTFEEIRKLAAMRTWLYGIRLSRNFGKEAALLAGLSEAKGRAVVTMDGDLQHPPELILNMIEAWRIGAKIVHGIKADRSIDHGLYALCADFTTRILSSVTGVPLKSASDFKLLDRAAVDVIVFNMPERERFFRGISSWIGFKQAEIPFAVNPSIRTESRWRLLGLVRLTITALISFTSAPLQIITILGFMTLLLAMFVGGDAVMSWRRHDAVAGYLTIISTLLIIGSFIMFSLGIIGIYVGKIYQESKRRPHYLVDARIGGGTLIRKSNSDS